MNVLLNKLKYKFNNIICSSLLLLDTSFANCFLTDSDCCINKYSANCCIQRMLNYPIGLNYCYRNGYSVSLLNH